MWMLAATDATRTTVPRESMSLGSAAWLNRNEPVRLTLKVRAQSDSDNRWIGDPREPKTPAQPTTASSCRTCRPPARLLPTMRLVSYVAKTSALSSGSGIDVDSKNLPSIDSETWTVALPRPEAAP